MVEINRSKALDRAIQKNILKEETKKIRGGAVILDRRVRSLAQFCADKIGINRNLWIENIIIKAGREEGIDIPEFKGRNEE